MELRELVSFYHVARLRSVSKAAQLLRMGQPTLSHQVRRLEQEFGMALFDRVKRPIQLTPEGTAILKLVTPIVQGVDALKTYVNSPEDQGSFTLGVFPDLALHHLPAVIQGFQVRYPEVHIRLLARNYETLMQLVHSTEVDLVICTRPLTDLGALEFEELFHYRFVLLTPWNHELLQRQPVGWEDITRWPLILVGPGTSIRNKVEQILKEQEIDYTIALEVDSAELIKRYVEIGMGVGVCSGFALRPEDYQRLGVVPLDHLLPNSVIGICRLKGRFLGRSLGNFIDMLKSELSDQP